MQTTVNVNNIQEVLFVAFSNVITNIISYIPVLIASLVVIACGFILGKWIRWLVIKILEALTVSTIFKGSPLDRFLEKAEITTKIEYVIGDVIKWLVILVFFIAGVNLLGLTTVSAFLNKILGYVPNVIAAILILTVGTLVAGLVETFVKASLSQVNRSTGRLASKITSYIVMVFTILASLAELNIAANLINTLFIGFVATLALGFGLSFGLGAKDLVAKILDDWYENLKKDLK